MVEGGEEILFVEKEKRISGHFFCFLRAEKTLGKLLVCDAEILLYTLRGRGRGGETVLTKGPNRNVSLF